MMASFQHFVCVVESSFVDVMYLLAGGMCIVFKKL